MEEAILGGSLSKVKAVVERKRALEARDDDGRTPLHVAAASPHTHIAVWLFNANPIALTLFDKVILGPVLVEEVREDEEVQKGRTPLHVAALSESPDTYDALVALGAPTHTKDKYGTKAEEFSENREAYRRLGEEEDEAEEDRDSEDMDNVIEGDEAAELLDDGPPDEAVDAWLAKGDIAALERLLLNGGLERLRNRSANNSASAAFLDSLPQYQVPSSPSCHSPSSSSLPFHVQAKIDAIHKAVEEGDVRRVKSLIDRRGMAMARDRRGLTPLHKALPLPPFLPCPALLYTALVSGRSPRSNGRSPIPSPQVSPDGQCPRPGMDGASHPLLLHILYCI